MTAASHDGHFKYSRLAELLIVFIEVRMRGRAVTHCGARFQRRCQSEVKDNQHTCTVWDQRH